MNRNLSSARPGRRKENRRGQTDGQRHDKARAVRKKVEKAGPNGRRDDALNIKTSPSQRDIVMESISGSCCSPPYGPSLAETKPSRIVPGSLCMAVSFEHDSQYGQLSSFWIVPFVLHPCYLVILPPLGAGAGAGQ